MNLKTSESLVNESSETAEKREFRDLESLGWGEYFEAQERVEGRVARVLVEHRGAWRVHTGAQELWAICPGRMYHQADPSQLPAVGDWVCVEGGHSEGDRAVIRQVLERKSKFSRKGIGDATQEQVVAANIDTLFLLNALDLDFNIRRLERYLLLAWESGAKPVVVLTKADLCDDLDEKRAAVESVAYGVPILSISALEGEGLEGLEAHLQPGKTSALLGSSGVGKSTLLNTLLGRQQQKVLEVRSGDHKGQHTTTARELFLLPSGALMIDTPGMRELQLWATEDGLQQTFEDVEQWAQECRFRDCQHGTEPGCAVLRAIEDGHLEADRLRSYFKLQRELAFLARKQDKRAESIERKRWKQVINEVTRKKVVY